MKTITRNIALTLTAIAAMATVGMASAVTITVTNSNVGYNKKILVCLPAEATNVKGGESISYAPQNAACNVGGIKIEKKRRGLSAHLIQRSNQAHKPSRLLTGLVSGRKVHLLHMIQTQRHLPLASKDHQINPNIALFTRNSYLS